MKQKRVGLIMMDEISKVKNPDREIRQISWEEFDRLIDGLEYQINKSGEKFNYITGIPRGGSIVGIILSHRLNIPYIEQGQIIAVLDNILFCDDVSDSGKTLQKINGNFNFKTATLHLRHTSKFKPDFFVDEIKEEWIRYPWEDENGNDE